MEKANAGSTRDFRSLTPDETEYVLVKTTAAGPWAEDLFFIIVANGGQNWEIPNAHSNAVFDWLKSFPNVDWELSIKAATCTDERWFVLWRKDGAPNFDKDIQNSLSDRLLRFFENHVRLPRAQSESLAAKIISSFQENQRAYHSLRHINQCLWELDTLQISGPDKLIIELAIWYHDLVYTAGNKNNEALSADRFESDLKDHLSQETRDKVKKMIIASAHVSLPTALDEATQLFLDIDMSILGLSLFEFLAYEYGVREEYKKIYSGRFFFRRKKFLKILLKKPIYLSGHFKKKYEQAAVGNIQWLLKQSPYKWIPTFG